MVSLRAFWQSCLGTALIASLLVVSLSAQDAKENKDDVFWEVRDRQQVAAAAQLVLARNPLTIAVLRDEGLRWKVWLEPEFLADMAPTLNPDWLEAVRDGTPMPNWTGGVADDEKRRDQIAVVKVWTEAVVNAFNTPADAFAKSAEENAYVTFAHLYNDPGTYRGKVIPVKGRLTRLRKHPATREAVQAGVPWVYEGWIFGSTERSRPFWVIFPTLPEGLKEAETMDRQVTFNGYFLKKLKYPAADGSKILETPFLIGPTLTLVKTPAPALESSPVPTTVMVWVSLLLVVVSVGLGFLSWYFRRGDLAFKQRLARLQAERGLTLIDHPDVTDIRLKPQPRANHAPDDDAGPNKA